MKNLKSIFFVIFMMVLLAVTCLLHAAPRQIISTAREEVPTEIYATKAGNSTVIWICNPNSFSIPLADVELDFNYSGQMPNTVRGDPDLNWVVDSVQGPAVVLVGGNSTQPPYASDPDCNDPISVRFTSSPKAPLPTGPFVFKTVLNNPTTKGRISVIMPNIPADEVSLPEVTITGMGVYLKKIVDWNTRWQVTNLAPGNYTITSTNVDNGVDFFEAAPIDATVDPGSTTEVSVIYTRVQNGAGNLNVNLQMSPAPNLPDPLVTITGPDSDFQSVVSWGTSWLLTNLSTGSYTISGNNVDNGANVYKANPVTVTVQNQKTTTAQLTYSLSNGNGRPSSWDKIKHIVVIIFENATAADALSQPFFNSITKKGAYLNKSFAVIHPSLPNYIALVAGDTLGVTSNDAVTLNADHLGNLLTSNGMTWKAYAEDLPSTACFLGSSSGKYVRRHEPFISFRNVQTNPTECAKIVPATQFFRDLNADNLPEFSLYIPNLLNDGHDTDANYADKWFSNTFGPIFNDVTIMDNTLFIVTYDEDDGGSGNQIYTAFIGAAVKANVRSSVTYNHYNVIRTIEEIYQLGTLRRKDSNAKIISDIWLP